MDDYKLTEQSEAALEEFMIVLAPLGGINTPTPGKIADQLTEIEDDLQAAIDTRNWKLAQITRHWLSRFRLALDSYDTWAMIQEIRKADTSKDTPPGESKITEERENPPSP